MNSSLRLHYTHKVILYTSFKKNCMTVTLDLVHYLRKLHADILGGAGQPQSSSWIISAIDWGANWHPGLTVRR